MSGEVFFDGFEQFKYADYIPAQLNSAGYTASGAIYTATGRIVGSSLSFFRSSVTRRFPWRTDVVSIGFACRSSARGGFFNVNGLGFVHDIKQALVVAGGHKSQHGYAAPTLARWYYYEIELNKKTGRVRLYINGKLDMDFTPIDPIDSTTEIEVTLNPYWLDRDIIGDPFDPRDGTPQEPTIPEDRATRLYDDFYVYEGPRLTPIQVVTRFPTDNQLIEWDGDPEGLSHWAIVGDNRIDPLNKHILTNVNQARDTFITSMTLPDTNKVIAIGAVGCVRKTLDGIGTIDYEVGPHTFNVDDVDLFWRYKYRSMLTPEETPATADGYSLGVKANFEGVTSA